MIDILVAVVVAVWLSFLIPHPEHRSYFYERVSLPQLVTPEFCFISRNCLNYYIAIHKNYNFFDRDCKKTPIYHLFTCQVVRYRTFQKANHIQSCSLNQPITTLVSITSFVSLLMPIFPFFHNSAILLFSEIVIFMRNW